VVIEIIMSGVEYVLATPPPFEEMIRLIPPALPGSSSSSRLLYSVRGGTINQGFTGTIPTNWPFFPGKIPPLLFWEGKRLDGNVERIELDVGRLSVSSGLI
jgi:hypothetical protein